MVNSDAACLYRSSILMNYLHKPRSDTQTLLGTGDQRKAKITVSITQGQTY